MLKWKWMLRSLQREELREESQGESESPPILPDASRGGAPPRDVPVPAILRAQARERVLERVLERAQEQGQAQERVQVPAHEGHCRWGMLSASRNIRRTLVEGSDD